MLDRFLSTRQIAALFGVKIRDVQYHIKQGNIPAKKVDYSYLIHEDDVPKTWPPNA